MGSPSGVDFFAGRKGFSPNGAAGELVGSASVATRSEIKLRMIITVSIAWCLSVRVSVPA